MKKVYDDSGLKETVFYIDENFVRVVNSSGSYDYKYVKHNGQLIAQEVDGVKTFIHPDHLGSSTVVTDINGTVIENTTYAPFGEVLSGGSLRYGYEARGHKIIIFMTIKV